MEKLIAALLSYPLTMSFKNLKSIIMSLKNSNNKIALVTGAASGLGYEFALLLAHDNYNIIMVDIDKEKLEKAKENIQSQNDIDIKILVKDLSKPNVANEIFKDLDEPVDILINNAGFGLFGFFAKTKWKRESDMLNLHINTTTQLTKLALKSMIKRGNGKILNVSSLAAFQPGPFMSIYYASKAYLLSFSQAIANELKGSGISVTVLCPGPTRTRFQEVVSAHSSKNKIKFNMASAKGVALCGYDAMMKGKTIAVPGVFNKFLAFLPRIVSRNMATTIVRKIQLKNRITN